MKVVGVHNRSLKEFDLSKMSFKQTFQLQVRLFSEVHTHTHTHTHTRISVALPLVTYNIDDLQRFTGTLGNSVMRNFCPGSKSKKPGADDRNLSIALSVQLCVQHCGRFGVTQVIVAYWSVSIS